MNQFRLSGEAEAELQQIWDYIARDSLQAADRVVSDIHDALVSLNETPGIGRLRSELAVGLRSFAVANYVIYYRRFEQGIEVAHVLHGARDVNAFTW